MTSDDQGPEQLLDEPFNAADPVSVNKARKKAGRKKQTSLVVMKALMEHKEGRAWLWELIEATDPYGNAVMPDNTHMTYYYLGQQNVGKRLLAEAQQLTDLYLLMAQEARRQK